MNERPNYIVATKEESELLFDLWRLAYLVTTSEWLPDPLTELDQHVQRMLDAGFQIPVFGQVEIAR